MCFSTVHWLDNLHGSSFGFLRLSFVYREYIQLIQDLSCRRVWITTGCAIIRLCYMARKWQPVRRAAPRRAGKKPMDTSFCTSGIGIAASREMRSFFLRGIAWIFVRRMNERAARRGRSAVPAVIVWMNVNWMLWRITDRLSRLFAAFLNPN